MYSKNLKMIVWVGLLVLCLSSTAWSQNPMLLKSGKKKAASAGTENISLPKDLNAVQTSITSLPVSVTSRYEDC